MLLYKDLCDAIKRNTVNEKRRVYRLAQAFVQRELGYFKHAGDDLRKNMTKKEYSDFLAKHFKKDQEEAERQEAERTKRFLALKQQNSKKAVHFDITKTAKQTSAVANGAQVMPMLHLWEL